MKRTQNCRQQCVAAYAVFCMCGQVVAGTRTSDDFKSFNVWRASRTEEGVPAGAAIRLKGSESVDAFHGFGNAPSGAPIEMELVADRDLESFLAKRFKQLKDPEHMDTRELCESGRFLLNDPRVGLFNNQRMSYEIAMTLAQLLGRILVMPGFFKFPHPQAYDGTQWVAVRELFDWNALQNCFPGIIEIGDLLDACGPNVLDKHVTVPFGHPWMRSVQPPPWINGTRRQLRWKPPEGGREVQLRSRKTQPMIPIELDEPLWYLIRPLLETDVASARTVRVHGLIAADDEIRGLNGERPVCFFPGSKVMDAAQSFKEQLQPESSLSPQILALHVRVFKPSTQTSGSYVQPEGADWFQHTCNIEPDVFLPIASWILVTTFNNFWPSHVYVASNEGDPKLASAYAAGLPGLRRNSYTIQSFDEAIQSDECAEALRSVLVDAAMCALADHFIGNSCSTMSMYIKQLRQHMGKRLNSSVLLGGVTHLQLFDQYRRLMKEDAENR